MRLFTAIVGISLGVAAASTSSQSTAQPPAGWQTYTNAALNYSIAYPAGWQVDDKWIYTGFGPDHDVHGVMIGIPAAMGKGTNLSHDMTGVSVESGGGQAGPCDAKRFLPDPEHVHDVKANGHTWSVAVMSEGAAGNLYDSTVFVLKDSPACLAIRYTVHSTNIGNYDPGTIKAFNEAALKRTFDQIRATFATTH